MIRDLNQCREVSHSISTFVGYALLIIMTNLVCNRRSYTEKVHTKKLNTSDSSKTLAQAK